MMYVISHRRSCHPKRFLRAQPKRFVFVSLKKTKQLIHIWSIIGYRSIQHHVGNRNDEFGLGLLGTRWAGTLLIAGTTLFISSSGTKEEWILDRLIILDIFGQTGFHLPRPCNPTQQKKQQTTAATASTSSALCQQKQYGTKSSQKSFVTEQNKL